MHVSPLGSQLCGGTGAQWMGPFMHGLPSTLQVLQSFGPRFCRQNPPLPLQEPSVIALSSTLKATLIKSFPALSGSNVI